MGGSQIVANFFPPYRSKLENLTIDSRDYHEDSSNFRMKLMWHAGILIERSLLRIVFTSARKDCPGKYLLDAYVNI